MNTQELTTAAADGRGMVLSLNVVGGFKKVEAIEGTEQLHKVTQDEELIEAYVSGFIADHAYLLMREDVALRIRVDDKLRLDVVLDKWNPDDIQLAISDVMNDYGAYKAIQRIAEDHGLDLKADEMFFVEVEEAIVELMNERRWKQSI